MPAFRQVGEKQLPNPVLYMAWSPKRDLIALANTAGELLLHRLANFQRVWSLAPNENTGKEITSLAWRPDGKILAFSVGDTKQVVLCDAEKAEILHLFPVDYPVSCMHWMEVQSESSLSSTFSDSEDESNRFLPKLPALPKSYSSTSKIFSEEKSDEVTSLLGEVRLNILVVGGPSGFVELYAYGLYKIATLKGIAGTCRSLCLASDLKSLSVVTEVKSPEDNAEIHYVQLDTGLLSSCLPELTRMARKFTHISTLIQYLRLSLTCMCEAWEDILMQMDLRLTKFVQEKNTSTQVQDEFLELLLWGHASPELQALLMNQLTVKGLKMLGQSIESSYSSIQKLVISHLQSGSEALLYHLSEVKGMALWKQKFQPLGLDPSAIEDAITAVGSFTLKASELLQVIDKSMKNFKAFFRWLYVAMLRMSEDHVPPELNKMTQKDLAFVADFLSEHFSANEELFDRKGKYFNVERVGQYLKDEDEDLVSPPNMEGNHWVTFVQQSTHLKESPLLFPTYPQKSLHFVKRMMEGTIDICLQKPAEVIGSSVKQAVCLSLYSVCERSEDTPRLFELPSLWNDKNAAMNYVVFCMPEISPFKIYILRTATDPNRPALNNLVSIHLNAPFNTSIDDEVPVAESVDRSYSCLDARLYDDETLTVVLQCQEKDENKFRLLAQLPLSSALRCEEEFTWDPTLRLDQQGEEIPVRELTWGNQSRDLENMKAQFVAVNGIRKVACVLSSNLRHIRVFEMDAEDEEDEERADESQDISSDQDGLEETSTNQGAKGADGDAEGEAETCEEMGEGSGDTLEQTSESDTL
ncbi:anaphase-promoting complex subunit 4 [Pygocentrus nattereri]|uniref:Anaphase-promoting complex subunit 4 n=1 Tax=Pygocentrus nattereri TaxID=42514 RepID=A0A3B4BZN6_PYGNA|nr:anaphase-promoting complex subunit 4 [Pygocentrus nattereri]XP_017543337.1 anaphase-promoting complex subunit 4 [Pygocentrus nattereri]